MALADLLYRLSKAHLNYARPLRLAAQRLLRREVVEITDRRTGLTFACLRGADRMLGETFHAGVYDVPMVPVRSGDLVVDVGANHGFATCWFAHRGARVVAFEPDPRVFRLLVANLARNGLAARVTAVQKALAGRRGRAELAMSAALGGGMSTIVPAFAAGTGVAVAGRVEVETETLPAVLEAFGVERIRLLKLDCEGSELEILAALGPADLARIDALAIEYHPFAYRLADLLDLLLGWEGFNVSKVATRDWENANLHVVSRRALAAWATDADTAESAESADGAGGPGAAA